MQTIFLSYVKHVAWKNRRRSNQKGRREGQVRTNRENSFNRKFLAMPNIALKTKTKTNK